MKMPSFFIRYACDLVGIMWFFEGGLRFSPALSCSRKRPGGAPPGSRPRFKPGEVHHGMRIA